MKSERNRISSKQLFVFIITVQIGIGILTLPSILVDEVGHDAWISIILAGIVSTLVLAIIMLLLRRYSNKSILEINTLLYSKYIGTVINIVFVIYLFCATILGIRLFIDVIKISALKLTPPIILTFFTIIPTVYLTWYGLKFICRFANVMFFIIFTVLVSFILIYGDIRITFLLPVAEAELTTIMKGIFPAMFGFLGIELITIIYPNITDKEKAMKYAIGANLFTMVFFIIVLMVTTALFGENTLKQLEFPLLSLTRSYRAPVFERLDLFFIALWFPAMESSFLKYYFSAYYSFNKIFKIEKIEISLIIFTGAVVLLSRIPKDLVEINNYLKLLNNAGLIIMIFLIVSYLFSFINKKGVEVK